jgi:hypothetical protein
VPVSWRLKLVDSVTGDVVIAERLIAVEDDRSITSVEGGGPDRGLLNSRSRATRRGLRALGGSAADVEG